MRTVALRGGSRPKRRKLAAARGSARLGLGRWGLRLAAAVALAMALGAAYTFWVRDLPVFAVDDVEIHGTTSADASRIRLALTSAARDMTTLHVDEERLLSAVAPFPVVKDVKVQAHFPDRVTVTVVEHRPAALLATPGGRVPVTSSGILLRGVRASGPLPLVRASSAGGARVSAPDALRRLRVLGAAPAALLARAEGVDERKGPAGVVVRLRDGPELLFGEPTRLTAKWAAVARILADPDAEGAKYVDVRIPERAVAGGLPVETIAPAPTSEAGGALAPAPAGPTGGTAPAPAEGAPVTPPGAAAPPPAPAPAAPTGGATPTG